MTSLSAAMIVRDCASELERCLRSLEGHVDEIVVVDTGSADGTVEIARAAGAKVGFFEWIDDFAAARNAALPLISTDWLLSIDSDDELVCERSREELEQLFASCDRVLLDYKDAGSGGMVKCPRLFRNVEGSYWAQPVHETFIQPGRSRQMAVDAAQGLYLLHHGYRPELNEAKIERNLAILRKQLESKPDDPAALFYFARESAWSGRYEDGLASARRLLETANLEGIQLADALAIAAWCSLYLKDYAAAVELGREARRECVPTVWTEYMLGLALINLGNKGKALEAADRACSLPYPEESMLALQEVWTQKRFELRDGIRRL